METEQGDNKPEADTQTADTVLQAAEKRRWCFKIVVLGDTGVGKTWLVESALTCRSQLAEAEGFIDATEKLGKSLSNQHQELVKPNEGDTEESGTIGVTFNLAKLEIEGSTVLLQLWDTSGKDRYRGLLANYMTDLSCVIIAYNPCADQAETCCRSLAKWHQFALESSAHASKSAAPVMFCVVAIYSGCKCPTDCDHVRCLAVGRSFAETLRGRFFQCRRSAEGCGYVDDSSCIGGSQQALTAQWLSQELLWRHLDYLACRQTAEEEEEKRSRESGSAPGTRTCCQWLASQLQKLALWPALAALLLGRALKPGA